LTEYPGFNGNALCNEIHNGFGRSLEMRIVDSVADHGTIALTRRRKDMVVKVPVQIRLQDKTLLANASGMDIESTLGGVCEDVIVHSMYRVLDELTCRQIPAGKVVYVIGMRPGSLGVDGFVYQTSSVSEYDRGLARTSREGIVAARCDEEIHYQHHDGDVDTYHHRYDWCVVNSRHVLLADVLLSTQEHGGDTVLVVGDYLPHLLVLQSTVAYTTAQRHTWRCKNGRFVVVKQCTADPGIEEEYCGENYLSNMALTSVNFTGEIQSSWRKVDTKVIADVCVCRWEMVSDVPDSSTNCTQTLTSLVASHFRTVKVSSEVGSRMVTNAMVTLVPSSFVIYVMGMLASNSNISRDAVTSTAYNLAGNWERSSKYLGITQFAALYKDLGSLVEVLILLTLYNDPVKPERGWLPDLVVRALELPATLLLHCLVDHEVIAACFLNMYIGIPIDEIHTKNTVINYSVKTDGVLTHVTPTSHFVPRSSLQGQVPLATDNCIVRLIGAFYWKLKLVFIRVVMCTRVACARCFKFLKGHANASSKLCRRSIRERFEKRYGSVQLGGLRQPLRNPTRNYGSAMTVEAGMGPGDVDNLTRSSKSVDFSSEGNSSDEEKEEYSLQEEKSDDGGAKRDEKRCTVTYGDFAHHRETLRILSKQYIKLSDCELDDATMPVPDKLFSALTEYVVTIDCCQVEGATAGKVRGRKPPAFVHNLELAGRDVENIVWIEDPTMIETMARDDREKRTTTNVKTTVTRTNFDDEILVRQECGSVYYRFNGSIAGCLFVNPVFVTDILSNAYPSEQRRVHAERMIQHTSCFVISQNWWIGPGGCKEVSADSIVLLWEAGKFARIAIFDCGSMNDYLGRKIRVGETLRELSHAIILRPICCGTLESMATALNMNKSTQSAPGAEVHKAVITCLIEAVSIYHNATLYIDVCAPLSSISKVVWIAGDLALKCEKSCVELVAAECDIRPIETFNESTS